MREPELAQSTLPGRRVADPAHVRNVRPALEMRTRPVDDPHKQTGRPDTTQVLIRCRREPRRPAGRRTSSPTSLNGVDPVAFGVTGHARTHA